MRWLASRGQAQCENGVCTRFIGAVRDVTAERRAREALRQLASDLERQVAERTAERDRIWRLIADLFAVAGFDGRFRRLNPAWEHVLGYDPEELVGSRFSLLLHADDQEAAAQTLRELSRGGKVERFEDRLRHADGSWRWIS